LLQRYVGKMVYRKRFTLEMQSTDPQTPADNVAPSGARYWLRLNGVFYWSQAYFNGVDLGRTEGYFAPQEFEVTPWVAAENTLVIEVECPDEENKLNKRLITGVFSHWDALDPASNPGGIWLPVEVLATGPVRINTVLLNTEKAGQQVAELRYRLQLDAASGGDVSLRWTFRPGNFTGEVQVIEQGRALAQGSHEISGVLRLRDPQLWWTHDMGDPNCYAVTLAVMNNDAVSDEYSFTFGVRRFELRNWIPYLNGVRFLVRGNNYPPGDTRIATMTGEAYRQDLRLARECHMNLLRVHAHVEHPAFYEAADQAGVLIWQDFPLQWIYDRAILPEAQRQTRQMIRLLYNHPSVVIWCMHNESLHLVDTHDDRWLTLARTLVSALATNWNRHVMDRQLKRVAEEEDRTRPVVRSSGEFAVPLLHVGTDTHFYNGWYYPSLRLWEHFVKRLPENIRFVTEFGAQSFPNVESCVKFMPADIAKIDWKNLQRHHGFQPHMMGRWVNWRSATSLADLVRLTQDYQIAVNRFFIDRLRYYKYRPTGGIVPFMFHDSYPAVLWSVVDYWRVPKRSYDALRMAFSPQYIFTLIGQDRYQPGTPISLPIYVVNDAHRATPVSFSVRLTDPYGAELAHIVRDLTLPPDCMAMEIERLRLTPPMHGSYRLALTLENSHGVAVDHAYEVFVAV
jgi:beta-mannosidase